MRSGLGAIIFMGIFFYECKVYDLATAMFFALGLGLMVRRQWSDYFLIFVLGALNRETMVLMAGVFAVYGFRRMRGLFWMVTMGYQVYLFVALRVCLMVIFAEAPGAAFWFRLQENVAFMMEFPWLSVVHWAIFGWVFWICARKWHAAHPVLRDGLVVLTSVLMGFYFLFGWFFEVRVFAEVFPVIWVLGTLDN